MTNFLSKTKIYLFSVFVSTFVFLVACQPDANKLTETCFDEVQNQGELWIDCGGPNCPACLPTCNDCVLNGEETRPDCGGPSCPVCATCEDGIQNGHWINTSPNFPNDTIWTLIMEKGIDCGYPCPNYCESSCGNGIIDGVETGIDCDDDPLTPCPACNPFPSCNNGIMDGFEIGIDCDTLPGGCPDCGGTCNDGIMNQDEQGIDCGSYGCLVPCGDNTEPVACPTGTCFDGIMNNGEEGIDCGGSCLTEDFMPILCPPPTQYDGVQNANETGIDCGSGTSYTNAEGVTAEIPCPTCEDDIKNGFETGVDCGGNCTACPTCCDGIYNGEELDINQVTGQECIWGGAPNPYNHPCPICESWVTAIVTIPGGGGFVFGATGPAFVIVTKSAPIGGFSKLTIKATDPDGNKLEILYDKFSDDGPFFSLEHPVLNPLPSDLANFPDASHVWFTPNSITNTWKSDNLPAAVQTGVNMGFDDIITKFGDENYFRGGAVGTIDCNITLPPTPWPVTIEVNALQWGVFFTE